MTEQFRLEDYEEPIRDMAKVALCDLFDAIDEHGLTGGVTGHSIVTERTPKLNLTSATTTIYRATVLEQIDAQLFRSAEPPMYLRHVVSMLCEELTDYLNVRFNGRGQTQLYAPNEKALQRHIDAEWFSLQHSGQEGTYDVQLYHANAFHPIGLHLVRPASNNAWSIEYGYQVNMVFPHAVMAEIPGEVTLV